MKARKTCLYYLLVLVATIMLCGTFFPAADMMRDGDYTVNCTAIHLTTASPPICRS